MAIDLKFLHASDLHLDEPIAGMSEIPAHLKSTLANAPYTAAQRLFDRAIAEKVDFVLLSGDVVDLERGGARSSAFLPSQFERLAGKNIHVYWCGGSVDYPDRWPASIRLPANVTIFPSTVVERIVHQRNGKAVATIVGAGHDARKRSAADFRCEATDAFPVALMNGELDTTTMTGQNIRYWALGGRHTRTVIDKTGSLAVYPGTTQSRRPGETGAFGCTMVSVDDAGRIRPTEIELDSVRWSTQQITVAENASEENLKTVLADRCSSLRLEAGDRAMLVRWRIRATGEFSPHFRSEQRQTDLIKWLRTEFGMSGQGIWATELVFDPPENLPADWYDEDTILGEYLRATSRYQNDASMALGLGNFIPAAGLEDGLRAELSRVEAARRGRLLQQVAQIGVELLSPAEIEN